MLGNLHVRFGVGAGGATPPAYTTGAQPTGGRRFRWKYVGNWNRQRMTWPVRCRQPIGFLVLAWRLVLNVEIQRTVFIGLLTRRAVADGVTLQNRSLPSAVS